MREDYNEAKSVIGKVAAVTHISQDREMFGLCDLDSVHVFVCV